MLKNLCLIIFISLFSKLSFGQQLYSNEWINTDQTYLKIKIGENGIFKIDYNLLQNKGFNLENTNPKFIKLYKNGIEQSIFINGEADLQFNTTDYILFYGEMNDGELDKPLYENVNFQPNPYTSLYTDSSVYFLTVADNLGKRLVLSNENSNGLTTETNVSVSSIYPFPYVYYGGAYVLAETSESEYREGEGLAGSLISKGGNSVFDVNTNNQVAGTPFKFSFSLIGRSNASASNPLGRNHHYKLEVTDQNSTFISVSDSTFRSYSMIKQTKTLQNFSLNNITKVKYSIPDDLSAVTDYQAPGYFRFDYERNLNIQGLSALSFNGSYTNKALLRFTNSNLSSPFLIDFANSNIVSGFKSGANLDFVISPSQNNKFYLFDESNVLTPKLETTSFTGVKKNIANDFIIITNKKLETSALEYQTYRSQTGHTPLIVYTDDIFNEFYFGLNHPLALRNFVQYLQNNSSNVKYVFLLGKGISNAAVRSLEGAQSNLVPSIGYPPSDNMYSAPLYGSDMAPILAISRLPATNNQQVIDYLDKLKTYESKTEDIGMKKIIHVSGGGNISDNNSFANYLNNAGKFAQKESFGAEITLFKKNVTLPVTNNLQDKIISEINKGTNFLTFLGHGSAFTTEVNFGEPNELATNSLLTYMINGCLAGNPNTLSYTIGEKYLFEPKRGAVGWIATSDEGVASYLMNYSQLFYKNSFNTNYGGSIASNLARAIKEYQNPNDILNRMHSRQFNLQGDPALTFYSAPKPDFYIESGSIFINSEKPSTSLDSLTLGIIIKNKGKALNDSLKISLTRTFKDNTTVDYGFKTVKPIFNTDTVYITVETGGKQAQGDNLFTVIVDADNKFNESNELNNSNSDKLYLPGNGVNILFPKKNAITSNTQVELVVQSSDLFTLNKNYLFEIDTLENFSSSWKKTVSITSNALAKTNFNIPPVNGKAFYWRSKLDLSTDDGGDWQYSSFTFRDNIAEGFSQKGDSKAYNPSFKSIVYNTATNKFEFEKTTHIITLYTRGDDAQTSTQRTFFSSWSGRLAFAGYDFSSFTLVALDPLTGGYFSFPSVNNFQNYPPDYTGQYFFDLNNNIDVDSLVNYINKVPEGYYVLGFNGRNVDLKGMPQRAKDAFAKLGCLKINDINAGEPYLFFGEKGTAPGLATEITADYNSTVPASSQNISLAKEYNPFFNTGYYNSEIIGPAKSWEKVNFNFREESGDVLNYQVIAVDKDGQESTILSNASQNELSISNIDANKYPYLKLRATTTDNVKRTPAQLLDWSVSYEEVPENTINLDLANLFHSEQVQQGDSVTWKVGYQNISKHKSDSIKVYAVVTTPQRNQTKTLLKTIKPLDPSTTELVEYSLGTLGLTGENNIRLEFDSNSDDDSYTFNNQVRKDFTVLADNKEPSIDITFDGKHIINREIVSPTPNITIFVQDENQFLLLNDTTVLEVSLKTGDDEPYKRVYYKDGKLTFTPATSASENNATVAYRPDKLEDGIYTLKLRSKDKTGNYNANSDYEISFEVINKSTITNFYPYPNPVVNAMKFVFTLTGEIIPDKIKVQISNMSGKVVREVLKEELGDLKIGNNVSDFTWDGTDQFGDRLANGVYFFKVFIQDANTDVKHRNTTGDKYFRNQTGKIYLLK